MDQVVKHIQLEQEPFVRQEPSEQPKQPREKNIDDIVVDPDELLAIRFVRLIRQEKRNQQAERLREWLQEKKKI